jgi:hypothetical protein
MTYTVNITQTSNYKASVNVSGFANQRDVKVYVDDVLKDTITCTQGGYNQGSSIALSQGEAIIKLEFPDGNPGNSMLNFKIEDDQTAYQDSPVEISGTSTTIPVWMFDEGGNNIAFKDWSTTLNDIRTDSTVGVADTAIGRVVGGLGTGEWWEYTVNVTDPGTYEIKLEYYESSGTQQDPRTVTVSVDETEVTVIDCWNDTSQGYVKAVYGNSTFSLTSGTHRIRIYLTEKPGNGVRNIFLEKQ